MWEWQDSNLQVYHKGPVLQTGEHTICSTLPRDRKEEDGSVDILFYDWRYSGVYLQTPMILTDIHSHVIGITIPQSTYNFKLTP
jgi:hypothetical protein